MPRPAGDGRTPRRGSPLEWTGLAARLRSCVLRDVSADRRAREAAGSNLTVAHLEVDRPFSRVTLSASSFSAKAQKVHASRPAPSTGGTTLSPSGLAPLRGRPDASIHDRASHTSPMSHVLHRLDLRRVTACVLGRPSSSSSSLGSALACRLPAPVDLADEPDGGAPPLLLLLPTEPMQGEA